MTHQQRKRFAGARVALWFCFFGGLFGDVSA